MKKIAAGALFGIAGCLLIAQFRTIQRTNPPLKGDLVSPPEIETLLRQACYDCHSNETHWPWYSYIAPISWLAERDVEGGRKQLNFSEWGSYYPTTRKRKFQWMERTLHEETMPPWHYRILHPGASLTPQDLAALEKWIESEIPDQR
jgi:Haem-binding domain